MENLYILIWEMTDKLLRAGFKVVDVKKGKDGTHITSFEKDGFEVIVLQPPKN